MQVASILPCCDFHLHPFAYCLILIVEHNGLLGCTVQRLLNSYRGVFWLWPKEILMQGLSGHFRCNTGLSLVWVTFRKILILRHWGHEIYHTFINPFSQHSSSVYSFQTIGIQQKIRQPCPCGVYNPAQVLLNHSCLMSPAHSMK